MLLVGETEETKQPVRGGAIDCLVCRLPTYGKVWIDRIKSQLPVPTTHVAI